MIGVKRCAITISSPSVVQILGLQKSSARDEMDSRVFFFFSSRRRHTRFDCDWSSDVCSSDLKMRERVHSCRYRFQKESPFHKPPSLGGRERPVAAPEAPREHCFRTPLGHWRTYGRLQASNTSEADSQRKTCELWE